MGRGAASVASSASVRFLMGDLLCRQDADAGRYESRQSSDQRCVNDDVQGRGGDADEVHLRMWLPRVTYSGRMAVHTQSTVLYCTVAGVSAARVSEYKIPVAPHCAVTVPVVPDALFELIYVAESGRYIAPTQSRPRALMVDQCQAWA